MAIELKAENWHWLVAKGRNYSTTQCAFQLTKWAKMGSVLLDFKKN